MQSVPQITKHETPTARHRIFTSVPSSRLRRNDRIAFATSLVAGLIIIAMLAGILQQLVTLSMPALQRYGLGFLTGSEWDPVHEEFGALPFIYGTLVSSTLA